VADFAIRWNDFSGGDYGRLDPSRADTDQFSGRNMKVYRTGLIGPRAGFKQIAVSGLPTHPVVNGPMGFDVYGDDLYLVMGDLYKFPMTDPATATAFTGYPVSATTPVSFASGNEVLYSLLDGALYKHVGTGTSLVATPVDFSDVVRWGYFMVAVDASNPWRVYFNEVSAAGTDFDSWPSNNYLDVGNEEPITALVPIYNTLFVGKESGWWAVSGTLGVQAYVREIVIGNGPTDQRLTSVTTDNRVIYWPVEQVPAWFNGERVYLEERQRLDPRALPFQGKTCIVTPTSRTLILAGEDATIEGTDMLVWKNRGWAKYVTPFDLGALAPANVKAGASMPDGVIFAVERPSQVGATPVVMSFEHDNDRPSHNDDTWAAPIDYNDTDLVTGTFSLPAWYDGQGRMCRVRGITIQFRKWASGIADTYNQMRVTVDALGAYEAGTTTTINESWVESCDLASTAGTSDSWRVPFGEQGWANGFQVRFPAIRGVAIQEVIAHVDVRKDRR
jgi:hypothetical protein